MAPDDPRDGDPDRPMLGFQSYADGTPRASAKPGTRFASDDPEDDWGDDLASFAPAKPSHRRRVGMVAMGSAAVLAAFAGGYLVARTDPPVSAEAGSSASEAAAMAAARPMNVQVAEVTPLPVPSVDGEKLEVLPRNAGAATPDPVRAPPPPRAALSVAPVPTPVTKAEAPPGQDAVATAPPPSEPSSAVRRPSYDCADQPSAARAMVCRDAGLARMDQRMKQAYVAALAAGVPEEELAAEQDDWLSIREEAARYSRRSVVNIYRQRIDELESMSERNWQ